MKRRTLVAFALMALLAIGTAAQTEGDYLDVFITKVKPEKRAEFDTIIKKMVDVNRQQKGDFWLTTEVTYGEQNTVYFTSMRKNYGDIEQGTERFMSALNKALGPAGAGKLFQDFNNCIASSRGELRRRRPDLSINVPSDAAGMAKLLGESRWLRTNIVRVRPGRTGEYEANLKAVKAAVENTNPKFSTSVSQSMAGQAGTVFYITTLRSSLGGFDPTPGGPSFRQMLGEDGFQKYIKTISETVLVSETNINRFVPELSNPPLEVIAAGPEFWGPKKAAIVARAKTKPAETAKAQQ